MVLSFCRYEINLSDAVELVISVGEVMSEKTFVNPQNLLSTQSLAMLKKKSCRIAIVLFKLDFISVIIDLLASVRVDAFDSEILLG